MTQDKAMVSVHATGLQMAEHPFLDYFLGVRTIRSAGKLAAELKKFYHNNSVNSHIN
jgi:hypothetical protein